MSDKFRNAMIAGGDRAVLLRNFDLDPDELAEVMAIRAATESEFYKAMDEIITRRSAPQRGQKP